MKYPDFKDWIFRKLGAPLSNPNLDDKQVYDRIMEAINKFMKHHCDGSHKEYYMLSTTVGVRDYALPKTVYSVLYAISPNDVKPNAEMMQVVFSDIYKNNSLMRINPVDWAVLQTRLSLIRDVFSKTIDFIYNPTQHTIRILDYFDTNRTLCLEVYAFDDIASSTLGEGYTENILEDEWVRDYALALCEEQWGVNLAKLKNIGLLGNISIDPTDMLTHSRNRIEELKADLNDRYGGVDQIFWG